MHRASVRNHSLRPSAVLRARNGEALLRARLCQHREPVAGLHRDQPAASVSLVRNHRDFPARVSNRLGHRLVDVEALNDLDLEMESGQVRADDIRTVR